MKTAYENFKKDCPELNFDKKDEVIVRLDLKNFDWLEYSEQIQKLEENSNEIPEMKYLIDFMKNVLRIARRENKRAGSPLSVVTMALTIDLNKLKYCKTILCYMDGEYTEGILNGLDFMQDQMVDEFEINKNRVFHFPKEKR